MHNQLRTFFDHHCHELWIYNLAANVDVLAFHGEERLSHLLRYRVEFTFSDFDIAVDQLLGEGAHSVPRCLSQSAGEVLQKH